MIRAIIFDFNGVIADDETPHVVCFQQALADVGLSLTKDEYYGTYLGMDERTCTSLLLMRRDGACDDRILDRVTLRKSELFRTHAAEHPPELFPGVVEFVKGAKPSYRLAIASGGRREQIDAALAGTPIERDFELIISAEDCPVGKPDPAIYVLALKRLNAAGSLSPMLAPAHCLVIEDSLAGIRSAKAAGMRVLAVATTYPLDKLRDADDVLTSLREAAPHVVTSRLVQTGLDGRFTATQPE